MKYYERDNGAVRRSALQSSRKNDFDVLKAAHRFLRDDQISPDSTYEQIVATKYYAQLFKQYACIDLKHYKSSKIALRWRTEDEVVKGVGQFSCSAIRCEFHNIKESDSGTLDGIQPSSNLDLKAWEINFAYSEPAEDAGGSGSGSQRMVQKNALVKVSPLFKLEILMRHPSQTQVSSFLFVQQVVLCPRCSKKLRYSREQESRNTAASSSTSRPDISSKSKEYPSQRRSDSKRKKSRGSDDEDEREKRRAKSRSRVEKKDR